MSSVMVSKCTNKLLNTHTTLACRGLVTPGEVRQGALLEAVEAALASNTLLPNTGHHLSDVDCAAFAAALAHDQGTVVVLQGFHAHLHASTQEDQRKTYPGLSIER